MIQAYTNVKTQLTANSPIPLENIDFQKGCNATIKNNTISLNKNGIYSINATFTIVPSATPSQLNVVINGVPSSIYFLPVEGTTQVTLNLPFLYKNCNLRCPCQKTDIYFTTTTDDVLTQALVQVTQIC